MKDFIFHEVKKMREVYNITPERIISDYRKEKREMDGYKGRQILELIQNADDASELADSKHVYIDLTDKYFSISNNGEPFTKDGIKSLMYSDLSPKARMQNKIGNKGTGFRSVLSWSKEIRIKSYDLSVRFSEGYAEQFLMEIIQSNPQVKQYFDEQNETNLATATLVVPQWIYDDHVRTDFETTIRLELLPNIYDDIIKQINEIDCETMLFLQNVKQLTIKYNAKEIVFKKNKLESGITEIIQTVNGEEVRNREWYIKKREGQYKNKNFEVAIAYTEQLDDQKNLLYSYFKTDVSFPFPAIIHGTFNLDANRNHLLKNNDENIHLLNELIDLLIETSIGMTKCESPSYAPLTLLCMNGEFSTEIKDMGFEDQFLSKIKQSKLFPTINKKYLTFTDEPKFYNAPFANVFPSSIFPELMLYTDKDEIINLLSRLSGNKTLHYDYHDFLQRVNKCSTQLKMKQRVHIIKYILKEYSGIQYKNMKTPNLILDQDGKTINSLDIVFINPSKSETLENPPAFSNIKFLNREMEKQLKAELSTSTPRELANKLHVFNVREYAFDTVASRMISRLRKRVKNDSKTVKNDIIKTTKWFYSIYQNVDERMKENKQREFFLLNRQGVIAFAKDLFIGEEYGNSVAENLLQEVVPNHFVAGVETYGLESTNQLELIEFLTWLGANKYPKIEVKEIEPTEKNDYLEHVKSQWSYPLIIEDCNYENLQKFSLDYRSCTIKVAQINLLDEILEKVPSQHILDWFMEDERMNSLFEKGYELTSESKIGFKLGYKDNRRYLSGSYLASYITWKVRHANWVDVEDKRVSPTKCCLARNSGINFSPLVEFPSLNEYVSHITERKSKQKKRELYEDYLIRTGVASDFGGIDEKIVYSILTALPEIDPEGRKAKSFYRQIIQNTDIEDWEIDEFTYQEFIQKGKVFAVHNDEKKYISLDEVYYLDDKTVCRAVVDSFPLLDLDKRKGKEKVERILGVKPFKKVDFKLKEDPILHSLNYAFKQEFKKFIPHAYCYRYDKDPKSIELKKLNSIDIFLCTKVTVLYNEKDTAIEDYEYVEYGKNKVYMKIPSHILTYAELLKIFEFRDAISDIIASTIDVEGNRKDYRELLAKTDMDRRKTIISDFDNPTLLKDVKRLFHQELNEKYQFWFDVMKAVGKAVNDEKIYTENDIKKLLQMNDEFFTKFNRSVLFEDLQAQENVPYIIELFEQLQIDVEEFNQMSLEKISVVKFFESQLEKCKATYKKHYASYLYDVLAPLDIKRKQKYNQDLADYENLKIELKHSIKVNVKEELYAAITDLDAISIIDLDKLYFLNKQRLQQLLQVEVTRVNDFLTNASYDSLVFFGELEELQKLYTSYVKKEKEKDNSYTNEGLQEVLDKVKANPAPFIDVTNTNIPDFGEQKKQSIKRPGSGFSKGKNNEKIGLKGERYVYAHLMTVYSKVEWVSENAKLDQVFAQGEAGLGYDMKYEDKQENTFFVEVKTSTGDEESFFISANEIEFAEKHGSNYEIIFVTKINDDNLRKFYRLKNLFVYNNGQSRHNNNKFRLDAKEYRVHTRKITD
jgi:hypothetical protein